MSDPFGVDPSHMWRNMRISRKLKREKQIRERKALRIALKDQAIKKEWDLRFNQGKQIGWEAGFDIGGML